MKALFALFCLAAPAAAEMPAGLEMPLPVAGVVECHFATECVDAEPCQPTQFDARLSVTPPQGGDALGFLHVETRLDSDAGSYQMGLMSLTPEHWPENVAVFTGFDPTSYHMLTRAPNGATRYTVHQYEGPMAVTYLGNCTEAR